MKAVCAMCGRLTSPYVWIGGAAIGPKCARRAGLTPAKMPRGSRVKFAAPSSVARDDNRTMDLFEAMA